MDYTAIGDEMNIASRLQGLAKGGQILVTRSVYEATQSNFEFREFGTLPVKGKKKLVEVFEVIYKDWLPVQNKPIRFRPCGAKPYGFVLQLIMLIDLAEVP